MTREKHFRISAGIVRGALNEAVDRADLIHDQENGLIKLLHEIDQKRFYVRYGFKSLMGFCNHGLRFSKTQSQRLVTRVRRYEPASNIGREGLQTAGSFENGMLE